MTTIRVYNGRDNVEIFQIRLDGAPVDLSSAARIVVHFKGLDIVADSDENSDLFDWTIGDGKIGVMFGSLNLPEGQYPATLIVYDASHPNGQVVAHADDRPLFQNKVLDFKVFDSE